MAPTPAEPKSAAPASPAATTESGNVAVAAGGAAGAPAGTGGSAIAGRSPGGSGGSGSGGGSGTGGSGSGNGSGTGGSGSGNGSGAADRARLLAAINARVRAHRRYPDLARRRGIEGSVRLRFHVLADGRVAGLAVVRGADPLLDEAAAEAVSAAAPLPRLDGPLEIQLDFHLSDGSDP